MHSSVIPLQRYRIVHLSHQSGSRPFDSSARSDSRAEVQLADEHAAQTGAVAFLVVPLLLLLRKGLQHITQISDGKYGRGVESISITRAFRVRGVSNLKVVRWILGVGLRRKREVDADA